MAKLTLLTGECCCKLELSALLSRAGGSGTVTLLLLQGAAGIKMLLSLFSPSFHNFLWGGRLLFISAAALGDLFCFEHGQS